MSKDLSFGGTRYFRRTFNQVSTGGGHYCLPNIIKFVDIQYGSRSTPYQNLARVVIFKVDFHTTKFKISHKNTVHYYLQHDKVLIVCVWSFED